MKIMDKALDITTHIWDECIQGVFLKEMMNGSLSKEKFLSYIVQDSIYLRDYAKAYAMAMFKSKNFRDAQMLYSALGFVNDSENATRLKYLQDNNMTDDDVEKVDKLPECEAYTKFLVETAIKEDVPEILMAVMPCMVGYYIVFNKVKAYAPQVIDSYFGGVVEDYTSKYYKQCCETWMNYVNKLCENYDEIRINRLLEIFAQASNHELYFWEMAGREI